MKILTDDLKERQNQGIDFVSEADRRVTRRAVHAGGAVLSWNRWMKGVQQTPSARADIPDFAADFDTFLKVKESGPTLGPFFIRG